MFTHGLERFMAGNRCAKNKRTSSEQMLCTGSQEQRLVRVGEGSLTFSHHRAALAPWEGDRDTVLLTSKAVFPQRPHSAGASLAAEFLKNLPAVQETGFNCWVGKIPWRRKWQPTPVSLPGGFHGQRLQMDTIERLTLSLFHLCLNLPGTLELVWGIQRLTTCFSILCVPLILSILWSNFIVSLRCRIIKRVDSLLIQCH